MEVSASFKYSKSLVSVRQTLTFFPLSLQYNSVFLFKKIWRLILPNGVENRAPTNIPNNLLEYFRKKIYIYFYDLIQNKRFQRKNVVVNWNKEPDQLSFIEGKKY